MRKALFAAAIGGVAGAAFGALFAMAWLSADSAIAPDRTWLIAICSALMAFNGLLIGALSAHTQAAVGGGYARCVIGISSGVAVGLVLAQRLFAGSPGGKQLLFAAAGAVCASAGLRWGFRRTNAESPAAMRPRRRWFQFNLGMLLALFFAISGALALFVSGPLEQARIVSRVAERGGEVRYGSTAPGWVLAMLGETSRGWFDRVTELQIVDCEDADLARFKRLPELRRLGFGGAGVTDGGLMQLSPMPGLQALELFGLPSITDAGLAPLPELTNVEELMLCDIHISNAGLRPLKKMPRLRKLWLFKTPITDAGLQAIGELDQLEELSIISMPQVTDAGLKALTGLVKMKRLTLRLRGMTDAGLAYLSRMQQLEELQLNARQVTGTGFAELEGLQALERLNVSGAPINDQGAKSISRLRGLKYLDLSYTQITDDGLAGISTLPKLRGLGITHTRVTNAGLARLRPLGALDWFSYFDTGISDDAVKRLRESLLEDDAAPEEPGRSPKSNADRLEAD